MSWVFISTDRPGAQTRTLCLKSGGPVTKSDLVLSVLHESDPLCSHPLLFRENPPRDPSPDAGRPKPPLRELLSVWSFLQSLLPPSTSGHWVANRRPNPNQDLTPPSSSSPSSFLGHLRPRDGKETENTSGERKCTTPPWRGQRPAAPSGPERAEDPGTYDECEAVPRPLVREPKSVARAPGLCRSSSRIASTEEEKL